MKSLRVNSPVRDFAGSPLKAAWDREGIFTLTCNGEKILGQTEKNSSGGNDIVFIPGRIASGSEMKFLASPAENVHEAVQMTDTGEKVEISVNGKFFACYNYATPGLVRPYIFPVAGPGGKQLLRTPHSADNPEKVDHVHHKGIWVSHGDVNGTDNWSETEGHGYTLHKRMEEVSSGPVFGKIHAISEWAKKTERGGKTHFSKILEEERIIRVYNLPEEGRIIDHSVILRATEGEAVFRDTKESGLLSIRLNPSLEGRKGGLMVNSIGGKGEDECWGKRADWCDYSGSVEGVRCGISVFDCPGNLRYPTWWHIRDYGLFTANFLGVADFTGDKRKSGTYILPAYEELALNYRIYLHAGNAEESGVSEKYLCFIYPPKITVE